jgi:PleD family two-component response regulator
MKKTILVNVSSVAIKKLILSTIVEMNLGFVETDSLADLVFKSNLLKENVSVYIHELDYANYEEDFKTIKEATSIGISVMILLDSYSSTIIDDSLKAGADDVIALPIKKDIFVNKLKSLIGDCNNNVEQNSDSLAEQEKMKRNKTVIDIEIARAKRGQYSLLVIIVQLCNVEEEALQKYIDDLQANLRNTDVVLRYKNEQVVLACPFTAKESIVEVENKVRKLYTEHFEERKKYIPLHMYGVAYPKDGEDSEALLSKLEDGLHDSVIIGNMKGTLNEIAREDIEKYKKMFKLT